MERGLGFFLFHGSALLLLISSFNAFAAEEAAHEDNIIGVNYGMKGDSLPPPSAVVQLYKSKNIRRLRLFDPNPSALLALHGSGIEVVLGTLNEDLPRLASNTSYASEWVAAHVTPHAPNVTFRYVSAGNEVVPGDLALHVLPAMRNLRAALRSAGVARAPPRVTTAVSSAALRASYPPSAGAFAEEVESVMEGIAAFLAEERAPLLVNIYPYFAYSADPKGVSLDYALFTAPGAVVHDGGYEYQNLFDAMVDVIHAALERVGGGTVEVAVSETGWPSAGNGEMTTVEKAMTYNMNVIKHVMSGKGTPRWPGKAVETYIFAMFNEDQKPPGTEQNFGLFQPDMTEVYHVDFSP